jgi:GAF domain-containing protein
MYELAFDTGIIVVSLSVLLLTLRRRNRHLEYQPHSRKAIITGAALLFIAGAVNLTGILIADRTSWEEGALLVHSGGMVACLMGATLMVLGLTAWLSSLVKARGVAARRLRQLACFRALLTEIGRHPEADQMLNASLSVLVSVMGYKMGVAYRSDPGSSEMTPVAHVRVPIKNVFHLYDLYHKNPWYGRAQRSGTITATADVASLPEQGTVFSEGSSLCSLACVPITFSGKTFGVLGLYDARADRFSYQENQFLTSVGEMLGLAAERSLVRMKAKRGKDCVSAVGNLLAVAGPGSSLEDVFPRLSEEIKKVVEFDCLSLVVSAGPRRDVRVLSVGQSGGVLVERRDHLGPGREAEEEVMESGTMRLDADLCQRRGMDGNMAGVWPDGPIGGIGSRIIFPLRAEDFFRGAISLGHRRPHIYSAQDSEWLRPLTLVISQMMVQNELRRRLDKEKIFTRSARDFDGKLVEDQELRDLLEDVAFSLVAHLPRSLARVMLLSKSKDQLLNCACQQIRPEGINLRSDERFPLDELPWHRLTLEAKRPMLVNQGDPESWMSGREAQLIMDRGIGSALLVPVMLDGEAVGIISLGEMRQWDRQPLSRQETDFVRHKADQLSLALRGALLRRSNKQLGQRLTRLKAEGPGILSTQELSDLSYQIANPLTSIRGSAELLKLRQPDLDPHSLRYLSNIERGVDRIQQSFDKFLCRTRIGTGSQENKTSNSRSEKVLSNALLE